MSFILKKTETWMVEWYLEKTMQLNLCYLHVVKMYA